MASASKVCQNLRFENSSAYRLILRRRYMIEQHDLDFEENLDSPFGVEKLTNPNVVLGDDD